MCIRDRNYNEKGELSGSTLTMDRAFKNFMRHTSASISDLFLMASTTPAKAIQIDHLTGSIVPGKYADLVVLDADLNLEMTFFHGEII